ncbi:MAG: HlyD family secretion protein [Flavobacteriales bacterium]
MRTIYTISSMLALSFLFACGGGKTDEKTTAGADALRAEPERVVGIARIEPYNKIYPLGADVSGIVRHIAVRAGDSLRKGDLILELNLGTEQAQLAQSRSKYQGRSEKVQALDARYQSLEIQALNAQQTFERDKKLLASDAITRQAYDDSRTQYEKLRSDLQAARADLAEAKAALGELGADVNYYGSLLEKRRITAPENGMLLSLVVKPGQSISPGTQIGDFAPAGPLIAITEVDELFAQKIKTGQQAEIRAQGTTNVLTTGKVVFAAPYLSKKSIFSDKADNLEDRRVREVRIQIDKPEAVLIGSRVECVIKL